MTQKISFLLLLEVSCVQGCVGFVPTKDAIFCSLQITIISTSLAASLVRNPEDKEVRSDNAYTQCIIAENWGCVIQQMCTDDVMVTAWRPLYLPCNVWYTINPSPSGWCDEEGGINVTWTMGSQVCFVCNFDIYIVFLVELQLKISYSHSPTKLFVNTWGESITMVLQDFSHPPHAFFNFDCGQRKREKGVVFRAPY